MKKYLFMSVIFLMGLNALAQEYPTEKELIRQTSEYEAILKKTPEDFNALYKLGMSYHNLSAYFEKKFSKEAVKYLEMAFKLKPLTEVRSWLGSSYTLVARDTEIILEKITAVQQGIEYIDSAIQRDPENITARVVRIGNSLNLPDDFQRLDKVDTDFQYLFQLIKKDPAVFKGIIDPGRIFLFKAQYLVKQNKVSQALKFAKISSTIATMEETKKMISEFIAENSN